MVLLQLFVYQEWCKLCSSDLHQCFAKGLQIQHVTCEN